MMDPPICFDCKHCSPMVGTGQLPRCLRPRGTHINLVTGQRREINEMRVFNCIDERGIRGSCGPTGGYFERAPRGRRTKKK
jgi:hypothetical protein